MKRSVKAMVMTVVFVFQSILIGGITLPVGLATGNGDDAFSISGNLIMPDGIIPEDEDFEQFQVKVFAASGEDFHEIEVLDEQMITVTGENSYGYLLEVPAVEDGKAYYLGFETADWNGENYKANGYWSAGNATVALPDAHTLEYKADGYSGMDLTIRKAWNTYSSEGNGSIQGTVSLPDGETAASDLSVTVAVMRRISGPPYEETVTKTAVTIESGQNSAGYLINVPNTYGGWAYNVCYVLNEGTDYTRTGFYSIDNGNIQTSDFPGAAFIYINHNEQVKNIDLNIVYDRAEEMVLYDVSVVADTGGSICVLGQGPEYSDRVTFTLSGGETITLTAIADKGYSFSKWTSSGGGTFADAYSASTTFKMPMSDVIITAHFVPDGSEIYEFSDVPESAWFHDNVYVLVEHSIISEDPNFTFRPYDTINIGEFIKLVVTSQGYVLENAEGYWAQNYINKAIELGLVVDGEYDNYTAAISRGQMARIIARAINEEFPDDLDAYIEFITDYNDIPEEYREYVLKAVVKGIITGREDGSFDAGASATRAESATMIARLIDESQRILPDINKEKGVLSTSYGDFFLESAVLYKAYSASGDPSLKQYEPPKGKKILKILFSNSDGTANEIFKKLSWTAYVIDNLGNKVMQGVRVTISNGLGGWLFYVNEASEDYTIFYEDSDPMLISDYVTIEHQAAFLP